MLQTKDVFPHARFDLKLIEFAGSQKRGSPMHDFLIAFSFIAMLLIPCFATVQDDDAA